MVTCLLTASTTAPDDINGTAGNDTFNASAGRLQDNDVINGGAGTDTLNASLGASGDAYLTSVEVLNITAINASAAMEGDKILGATNLNVLGGGTLSYTAAAAGIAYSVAGDGTALTLTQAGTDTTTNSVALTLGAGKLGTQTLGVARGVDFETINITIAGTGSATITEAAGTGTASFAAAGDSIVVTGAGDYELDIADALLGANATAGSQAAAVVNASGHTGKLTIDLGALTTTNNVSAEKWTGVDAIKLQTAEANTDVNIITKVASGTEIIVDDIEHADNKLTITPNGSATTDALTVTLNNATAGLVIDLTTVTLDGFESATINSTGTDSATTVVANIIDTIAGTANDKNLTITGDKKLTAGVENTWSNIVSTNTSGVDLTVAAGTDIKFVGGAGNDRLEMDTVADITAADSLDGGAGKNTLAISAVMDADFSAAQLAVLKNFQVLEYEETLNLAGTNPSNTATAIDLTKIAGMNELFLNGVLDTDSDDTLTVKAVDGFVLRMGEHDVNSGAASQLDIQVTNALSAGTDNTVTVNMVNATGDYINGGFKIAGVENLNLNIAGDASHTVTLSDVDGVVLQNIKIASTNTGKASDGTTLASDSLTISGVESTLVRTLDASAFTGALSIAGMAGNFIATGATITGGSGANTITGGTGADTITTGKGNDLVLGGTGADVISTGAGADVVLAATGSDSTPESVSQALVGSNSGVYAVGDSYTVTVFGKAFTVVGGTTTGVTSLATAASVLATMINADANLKHLVTANGTATSGTISVTSKVDGNFTDFAVTGINSTTAIAMTNTVASGTNSTDADIVNLGAGADFVHTGGGEDVISLGANDLATDTVYILGANEGKITINDFEAGTVGSDVITLTTLLASNGTNGTTLTSMTNVGATADNLVFFKVTTATAAGAADTAAEIVTHLTGATLTGVGSGEKVIFAINDTVDTYLWQFTNDGTSGLLAAEFALVAKLVGVTDIANGDLALI